MKKLAIILIGWAFVANLAGCNTIGGIGRDLQKAGEKIEDTAKKK